MRRRITRICAFSFLLVLVLAAAGCGSKKSATTTTTTTTTEAAATTTATTAATTTTAAATTTAASGLGSLGSSENCQELENLGTAFASAFQGANGDVAKEAALLKAFADKTPSDIRPDFETLATAFDQIASDLKGVDLSSGKTPNAATLAKLATLSTQFSGEKFTQAATAISAWAQKNCGVKVPSG
jgi:hypothetical protein